MRVVSLESPLKGHEPLYVHYFLFFIWNIWKDFKVLSRFMQKWIQPPACSDHGLHRIQSYYWLAHFYLMKKSAKELLYVFWFGLRNDEILYLQAATQRTIEISPAFLEHGSVKKIKVWAHANRDPNKQDD
jgi:hypothetical protein